jgi:hypothetical protein
MIARRWTLALLFALAASAAIGAVAAQTSETVHVTGAPASLRAEPKPNAAILTTLKVGARLDVRGSEGDWYRVATLVGSIRIQGYVLKKSVTLDKPGDAGAAATPATTPKSATATPTSKPATATPTTTPKAAAVAPAATAPPPATTTKTGMSATIVDAGKTVTLTPSVARLGRMAERADSAHAAAMAMPIGASTPLPSAPASVITYLWLIDDVKSARVVTAAGSFGVQFRDVPGISPDDFEPALVALATTPSGPRVIRVVRGRVDQASRREADWDVARDLKEDVVKATVQVTERGVATLTPAAHLAPGEYAIVLRPTGNKKFSGASVLSAAADGRVFGTAWVIVVK